MPFQIGRNAVIRTKKYLESGRIYLNDKVKVLTIHFTIDDKRHTGMYDFAEWHLPQVQYKNPDVHCIVLKNMTPTPMIRAFTDDGKEVIIDADNKERKEILKQVIRVLGKPEAILQREMLALQKTENPANFGYLCNNHCICQVFGQVPCPSVVPVPETRRGKWFYENVISKSSRD